MAEDRTHLERTRPLWQVQQQQPQIVAMFNSRRTAKQVVRQINRNTENTIYEFEMLMCGQERRPVQLPLPLEYAIAVCLGVAIAYILLAVIGLLT